MLKQVKSVPNFKNEKEERKFWESHSSEEYIDWSKAKKVSFPNLKPSNKVITLRLPENIINEAKKQANRMDMPYQSLIKMRLFEAFSPQSKVKHKTIVK